MIDKIRKILEIGLAAAKMSEKDAKKIVDELVKAGHITLDEGKTLMKELIEKGYSQKENIGSKVSSAVKSRIDAELKRQGYVPRSEVERLKKRIKDLEKGWKKKRR